MPSGAAKPEHSMVEIERDQRQRMSHRIHPYRLEPGHPFLVSDEIVTEKSARKPWTRRFMFMTSSTKDKIKGSLREAKGKVKEESGKAIGNPNLQDRGTGEKVAGKVQKKIGDVKKVFGK
jgi:uncharacterized protein YjbJ (UPF0337 family)